MYLTPIRVLHEGIYLALIRFLHKGIYLAPTISQYLDTLHQLQCSGIIFLQMMSWNQGAVHKERHYPFWAHLTSVMVCGLCECLVD